MKKFEIFLEELIKNINTFKDGKYETYEIIPSFIEEVLGKETILEDYGFFEKSRDEELIKKAGEYKEIFKKVYEKAKKELKNDEVVFFDAEAVKAVDNKEGILFAIDVYDEHMRGVYRYFVEKRNLKELQ